MQLKLLILEEIDNPAFLCALAYPGHPKGCPNLGKKAECPPVKRYNKIIRLPYFAIINEFNLKNHADKMLARHPKWSRRQAECCLYWQPAARKNLKLLIHNFLVEHPGFVVMTVPEAHGINVTETLKLAGVNLEWPPVNIVRQVAIAGLPQAIYAGGIH